MYKRILTGMLAIIGASSLAGAAQAATPSFTTANVNLRAGPGTSYPVIVTVPNGTPITTYGCLENYNWCDVSWGTERGWMSASYIQITYLGEPHIITPAIAPAIGLTIVVYNRAYWDRYYYGRPWYRNWDRYYRPPPRVKAVQPLPPRQPKITPPKPNRPKAVQPLPPRANPPKMVQPRQPRATPPRVVQPRQPRATPPRVVQPRQPRANPPRVVQPRQPRANPPQAVQPRQRAGQPNAVQPRHGRMQGGNRRG
ncbi:SH3 domain-containing protein [Hoeflea sp. TYP-13]|uniref:SH3 domain-containing protein n=1 Tax=Hoeflea sp. TYP-13 TaxID=3230023 RepID=UPI0034C5E452